MLFRQPEEFALFLDLLGQSIPKFKVDLWGYCLMGNHWHLVVEVEAMSHLSRWMHWLCNRHVRLVHRENRSLGGGHIYQGRYKSFPIQDESYLYNVLLYVEANPLRAKLVSRAGTRKRGQVPAPGVFSFIGNGFARSAGGADG